MKLSVLSPVVATCITGCIALPAPISTSTHVPVSQDPSPPRPFPAGRIVEVNDPSPPRPFPKYPLDGLNPLEERDPLSRFPTDSEDEAHDPSPPRPFPAGHVVDVKNAAPPIEERDPSAPHKLVESSKVASDPLPPRPFPKYSLDGDNQLEERDPLSRFPTNDEKEAADPSPPKPFPAGHLVEVKDDPPSDTVEPRHPSPLLRTPEGSAAEANDPSPPRPFPAGRLVDTEDAPPSNPIESRSPSPLLRTPEGSKAEANDPSPPRPFPAGHPANIDPRDEILPPHHGGYFPPSNPPVPTPTAASAILECNLPKRTPSPTCTTTLTAHHFDPFNITDLTSTVYNTTLTLPQRVECGGCALTVTTVDVGNGPPVPTSVPTVTDEGTASVYTPDCTGLVYRG